MRRIAAGLLVYSATVASTFLDDMGDIFMGIKEAASTPSVKAFSAREIILRELMSNIQTSPQVIAFKVWEELDWQQWLSVPEIDRLRHEIVRPFVQPLWFHTMLMEFEGIRDIHAPAFMAYVERRAMRRKFKSREEFVKTLYVWIVYCVAPLEIWNKWAVHLGGPESLGQPPPCELKEIVSQTNGQTKKAVVISDVLRREYLLEELTAERQRSLQQLHGRNPEN